MKQFYSHEFSFFSFFFITYMRVILYLKGKCENNNMGFFYNDWVYMISSYKPNILPNVISGFCILSLYKPSILPIQISGFYMFSLYKPSILPTNISFIYIKQP